MDIKPELNLVIVRILKPVLYLSLLVLLRLLVVLVPLVQMMVLLRKTVTHLKVMEVVVLLQMRRPKLVARGDLGLIMGLALKIVMEVYQLVLVNVSVVHLVLDLQPVLALL
jgi:hypothetical protein